MARKNLTGPYDIAFGEKIIFLPECRVCLEYPTIYAKREEGGEVHEFCSRCFEKVKQHYIVLDKNRKYINHFIKLKEKNDE